MDRNQPGQNTNWLKNWRGKSGLEIGQVDQLLKASSGTTETYEKKGLLSIPCCELIALANIYKISGNEFFDILMSEIDNFRKNLKK